MCIECFDPDDLVGVFQDLSNAGVDMDVWIVQWVDPPNIIAVCSTHEKAVSIRDTVLTRYRRVWGEPPESTPIGIVRYTIDKPYPTLLEYDGTTRD